MSMIFNAIALHFSRKQKYAINAQIIGDSRNYIRDVSVVWPGTTHDARDDIFYHI